MMEERATGGGVHWSFWAISVVALIWNVIGSVNFLMQTNADTVAAMPEAYQAVIQGRPAWATTGFAIAVFGGALGCLVLLLRKSMAIYIFIFSLLGVIVTMAHAIGIDNSNTDFTPVWIGTSMSLLVAAFLIWYSRRVEYKGWIS